MSDERSVLVAHAQESYREFARDQLQGSGFATTLTGDSRSCITELFGERGLEIIMSPEADATTMSEVECRYDVVVVDHDLHFGGHWLFEVVRRLGPRTPILVVADKPEPERIASMLIHRIDDLLGGERPRALSERVTELLAREPALPGFEIISAAPHWVEVRIPARVEHFTWLRRFLSALEEALPGGERTRIIFALAELVRSAVEQASAMPDPGRITIACYRFQEVRMIRVEADETVSFTVPAREEEGEGEEQSTTTPMDVLTSPIQNPWLAAVARYADHFIASGSGNEVMLVRLLGEASE